MSDTMRRGVRTRALLAPSVAALLVWMIVPLAMTLWFSLQHYNLLSPGKRAFAGLYNYRYLLTGRALWVAMGNTLLLVGLVLAITLALGTLLAALLDREFPGRNICRLLVIAPFFMMPTVSALIWKNMLMNPVFGMFAWITRSLGLPHGGFLRLHAAAWPSSPSWPGSGRRSPCSSCCPPCNPSTRNCARPRAWKAPGRVALFWHIELPHMLRPMAVVAMIETIFFLSLFAEIYVTTGGGPGLASTNLAYLIFRDALFDWDVGGASAGGVIAIVLANIVAIFLMRLVGRNLEDLP